MPQAETDVKIKQDPKVKDNFDRFEHIPSFFNPITDLSDTRKKEIATEIIKELDAIMKERSSEGIDDKWEMLDNQYDGKMEEIEDMQFNLHKHTTKIKVDSIVTAITDAFFESDPVFAISPRPEFQRENGNEVTDKQEDFLDYKIDEVIPLEKEFRLAAHPAVLKGIGWIKIFPEIDRRKKKRIEVYKGDPIPEIDSETLSQRVDPATGQPLFKNKGLEEFVQNHKPDEPGFEAVIKKLSEGKQVYLTVEYMETKINDPMPKAVRPEDLFVRLNTNGYEGLCDTLLIAEKISNLSWWDLKKAEKKEYFFDIDELAYEDDKPQDDSTERKRKDNYESETYELYECTYFYKDEEEYKKGIFWVHKDKKLIVGAIEFPLWTIDCQYIPLYIKNKKIGEIYQPGIGEDLTDSNLAENAILNLTLQGAWQSNTITPITESHEIIAQFQEKRWLHGQPLVGKPGDLRFLNEYMRPTDSTSLVGLLQYLVQGDDEVSKVSSLYTGRESPIDPTAPASKTLALLERSGVGVRDYIKVMLRSFNIIGDSILQQYYQITEDSQKYKVNPEKQSGEIFATISREEIAAKTNVQSKALAFDFNRNNEKREDIALFSAIRGELLIGQNDDAVYFLLKNLIKGWSPKWRNMVDKILPPLDQFRKKQFAIAIEAVRAFVMTEMQKSQITKQPPQFDPRQLIAMMQDMIRQSVTPLSDDEIKAREEAQQGGG